MIIFYSLWKYRSFQKKDLHVHKNVDIHISIFILFTMCLFGAPFFTNPCINVVWRGGAAEVLKNHRLLWWQPLTCLYCWVWQVSSSTWQLPTDSSLAFSLWGDGSVKCSKISGRMVCPVRLDGVALDTTLWSNTSGWHSAPNHHRLWKRHTGLQANWILCFSGTLIFKLYEKKVTLI